MSHVNYGDHADDGSSPHGNLLQKLGRQADAEEQYREAIRLDPSDVNACARSLSIRTHNNYFTRVESFQLR